MSVAPKQKFSFKSARKAQPSVSQKDDPGESSHQRPEIFHSDLNATGLKTITPTTSPTVDPAIEEQEQEVINVQLREVKEGWIRRPSFSNAKSVSFFKQSNIHIILPTTASHAASTGNLSDLNHCIIDMSLPTSSDHLFSSLSLRNIKDSLIICGRVTGPAHVTNLENTVIVTTCRQLRMHECKNVDVYLQCSSRPIIEDCIGVRFAPLPEFYV
jgi:hypothetical protein